MLVLVLFKSMYVNKYGVTDTIKDDLSDIGDDNSMNPNQFKNPDEKKKRKRNGTDGSDLSKNMLVSPSSISNNQPGRVKSFHDQNMWLQFISFLKLIFRQRDYVILFISSPLVIQGFFLYPIALEFNYTKECFKSSEVCIFGLAYFLAGMLGALLLARLKGCGRLKYKLIFVAAATSVFAELAHVLRTLYIKDKECQSSSTQALTLYAFLIVSITFDGFFRIGFLTLCFLYLLKLYPEFVQLENVWNSLPSVLIITMSTILSTCEILYMAMDHIETDSSGETKSVMDSYNIYQLVCIIVGTLLLFFLERNDGEDGED